MIGPVGVLVLAFLVLLFTVTLGLWLDGRSTRRQARREARRNDNEHP